MEKKRKQKSQCKLNYEKLIARLTKEGRIAKSSRVNERFEKQLREFRKSSDDVERYLVLAFAGMERLTVEDVRRNLGDNCLMVFTLSDPENVMLGQAGVGKILVATKKGCSRHLARVPSVQRIFIFLGCSGTSENVANPILSKSEMKKNLIAFLENIECWNTAWKLRRRIGGEEKETLSFRATVIRDGPKKHSMNSQEVACVVGDVASKKFPTWSVNLVTYDVEIVMLVYDTNVVIGMSLFDSKICNKTLGTSYREWTRNVSKGKTACLKPSIAANLVQYADLKPNSVVLDCMSGVGTIPIEASALFHDVYSLGGEIDVRVAIPQACRNVANYQSYVSEKHGLAPDLCVWDVARLPLRSSVVDAVIVDLPFGMRCGSSLEMRRLYVVAEPLESIVLIFYSNKISTLKRRYPKALSEMARVVRPRGRTVLMTTLRRQVLMNISESMYWKIVCVREVNMGGAIATVVLADRSDTVHIL